MVMTNTIRKDGPTYSQEPGHRSETTLKPGRDLLCYLKAYAKDRPEVVAMWCFGIGFILGWKSRPW